jgi:hypothetical protein
LHPNDEDRCVLRFAPRYDERLLEALRVLDDRRVPVAEVCRRVGREAERLGLPRPSYAHVRRLVRAERERQDAERERRAALRELAADVAVDIVVGKRVNAYDVADRVQTIKERHA